MKKFLKPLSANDVGSTGAHMGGILIPKGDGELLAFLPHLDPDKYNPSEWIICVTPDGRELRLRYVYYNNRLHKPNGTRNEYRITHLTKYFRTEGAKEGDTFEISKEDGATSYLINVVKAAKEPDEPVEDGPVRIRISTGWRRVH
ncbi:EcoRII N-terminal effector-binding domain-containing protein [Tropicibacter oceani]|uniref:EcoRII N-terminal effector-binding domain-containing protein n=1 Tax=Tropicibacter oceani TaxID=3058420 RepID=A0ABY8QM68_9RHOB|nr:EcoRII N-terminal effector-binding domain-containing protein [Tropicibacter oceani]WGW05091.1 EcoRII N-terminal effector-binding domain-containing protein [Tropicibacter oceani]